MIKLEKTMYHPDVICPVCSCMFNVEFDNEYNYPELGLWTAGCPCCDRVFKFEINLVFSEAWASEETE